MKEISNGEVNIEAKVVIHTSWSLERWADGL